MKIISIGKAPEPWLKNGLEGYSRRLQGRYKVDWQFLPSSKFEGARARQADSQAILAKLNPADFVILLDETGENIDSPALSRLIETNLSRQIILVIGGAYGVDERLKQRANYVWSLSKLVFPHQLVRLILIEQLYRAQCIATNHPYHHQ